MQNEVALEINDYFEVTNQGNSQTLYKELF